MSESFTMDQSTDFATFIIDGNEIEVDIYQANDKLVEVDRKHLDDPTQCDDCLAEFAPRQGGEPVTCCPQCGSKKLRPSQDFLDDVAAVVRSYGPTRCSRRYAAFFYEKILECVAGIKKNTTSTPELPSGSTDSTPADSAPETSELT